jgi:hypothetical protein
MMRQLRFLLLRHAAGGSPTGKRRILAQEWFERMPAGGGLGKAPAGKWDYTRILGDLAG